MRRTIWLLLALLSACAPSLPPAPPQASPAAVSRADGSACRAGPDGEPGGTPIAAPDQIADRGIGGTGARPDAMQTADRGIGGTGIVGVVTGFASICVSGHEVAFSNDVKVSMDGAPASAATLRAGQLTAVEATGTGDDLRARRIVIRHEVSGPVEEVGADGVLRVAGQRVVYSARTWGAPGATPIKVGDWLAVSGLRMPDGAIEATRIDRRGPGEVTVHGLLVREGTRLRIGGLEVRFRPLGIADFPPTPGLIVTATGRYSDGVLIADTIDPDLLLLDPVGYFGPGVSVFVVEGYASYAGGRVRLGPRLDLRAPLGGEGFSTRRAVAEFERRGDGSLTVTSLREPAARGAPGPAGRDLLAPSGAGRFEPAPTPDRRFGPGGRGGAATGRRFGPGSDGPGGRRQGDAQPGGGGFSPPGSMGSSFGPGMAPGAAPSSGYGPSDPGDQGFQRH